MGGTRTPYKNVHRYLATRAGVRVTVFDFTITDPKRIAADLKRRLNSQRKALERTIEKKWQGEGLLRQSIVDLEKAEAAARAHVEGL